MFRKNKDRKYRCPYCNYKDLNNYYGYKAYKDIPMYLIDFYDMYNSKCLYCGLEYYFIVKK